jgi:hypothetical protein
MTGILTLAAAIANIALTIWALHQTLRNQHRLDAFASKLRWTIIFLGSSEFFIALHFLGTGLSGIYTAFVGGLIAGFFLFFPDVSYHLGKWILRAGGQQNSR